MKHKILSYSAPGSDEILGLVTFYFLKKGLQTMLWHHNARVNSHQRWKQTRFRVCFHLWCELTQYNECNGMTSFMEFMLWTISYPPLNRNAVFCIHLPSSTWPINQVTLFALDKEVVKVYLKVTLLLFVYLFVWCALDGDQLALW